MSSNWLSVFTIMVARQKNNNVRNKHAIVVVKLNLFSALLGMENIIKLPLLSSGILRFCFWSYKTYRLISCSFLSHVQKNTIISSLCFTGARGHGQEGALCPLWKRKMGKYAILCPNKLPHRRLVTLHKTRFDVNCENCRIKVNK